MELNRNTLFVLVFVALLLFSFKQKKDIGQKEISSLKQILSFNHDVAPTLLQLYPDENLGVGKFYGMDDGIPNQLVFPNSSNTNGVGGDNDRAKEMKLDTLTKTYGSVSFDMEKDGYSDLIVAMDDGVWLFKNNLSGGKPFSCKKVMDRQHKDLYPDSLIIHDFDRDGNFDIYVRQRYQETNQEGPSVVLRHTGSYEFVDVTSVTGEMELQRILKCAKEKYLSDPITGNNNLIIKMPNNIEFAGCRVTVVAGSQNLVKYNLIGTELVQNSTLVFNIKGKYVDKVKIRTIYGKDYNYDQQEVGSVLKVQPVAHFEASRNLWKSTSMG